MYVHCTTSSGHVCLVGLWGILISPLEMKAYRLLEFWDVRCEYFACPHCNSSRFTRRGKVVRHVEGRHYLYFWVYVCPEPCGKDSRCKHLDDLKSRLFSHHDKDIRNPTRDQQSAFIGRIAHLIGYNNTYVPPRPAESYVVHLLFSMMYMMILPRRTFGYLANFLRFGFLGRYLLLLLALRWRRMGLSSIRLERTGAV